MSLYFLLVFVLAVPFWLWGGGKLPLPINLPAGALVALVISEPALCSHQRVGALSLAPARLPVTLRCARFRMTKDWRRKSRMGGDLLYPVMSV
jgi:hypothetical protein